MSGGEPGNGSRYVYLHRRMEGLHDIGRWVLLSVAVGFVLYVSVISEKGWSKLWQGVVMIMTGG